MSLVEVPSPKKLKILIVEDELIVAEDIKHTLQNFGYSVVGTASHSEMAIQLAKEKMPDLLIMDIMIKGEDDGITTAEIIKSFLDVPIIFVTAYSDKSTIERAKPLKPAGYLIKPFDSRELFSSIETSVYKHSVEKKLRESEERYRRLVEGSPDIAYRFSKLKGGIFWSSSIERILGFEKDEYLNNPLKWFSSIHPDDIHLVEKAKENGLNGKYFEVEYRIQDVWGKWHWFNDRFIGRDLVGCDIIIEGLASDITETKIAHEALLLNEKRFRTLFNNVGNIAVQGYSPEGTVIFWNKASEELYGYSEKEALGKQLIDLIIPPFMREGVKSAVDQLMKQNSPIPGEELQLMKKDGSLVTVYSNHTILEMPGKEKELFCIDIDLSELKSAEKALRESEQRLKHAESIAHVGYFVRNLDTNQAKWSDEIFNILGLDFNTRDLKLEEMFEFAHPDDRSKIADMIKDCISTGNSMNQVFRIIRKDGEVRSLHGIWNIEIDETGTRKMFGTMQDITERMLVEEKLRDSEARWQFALDGAGDGLWDWNVQTGEVYFSKMWKEMLGYDEDEIKNQLDEWKIRVHPDDFENVSKVLNNYLDGISSSYSVEMRMLCKDGSYKWVLDRGKIITRTQDGKPLRVVGTHKDIHKRMIFEQELKEERLLYIGGKTVSIKWQMEKENPIIYVSPNVNERFGYSVEDIINGRINYNNIIHPDDFKIINDDFSRSLSSGSDHFEREYRIKNANGDYIWIYDFTSIVRDVNGKILHFNGYLLDITERMQAEIQLRNSEEKFSRAFNTSPDSININRMTDGLYVSINEGFTRITGYTEEDVIGKTSSEINIWNDINDRKKLVQLLLANGRVENLEAVFRTKTGKMISGLMSANVITLNGEKHIISITRDITERKIAEEHIVAQRNTLNAIFENVPYIMVLLDKDGRVADINRSGEEFVLKSRSEVIGKLSGNVFHCLNTINNADCGMSENCLQCPIRQNVNYTLQTKRSVHNVEGSMTFEINSKIMKYNLLISTNIVEQPDGNYVLVTVVDLTDKKRIEKELYESEERYRLLVDSSPDSIIVYKGDKFVYANQSAIDLIGAKSFEELAQISVLDIVHPDYKLLARERIQEMSLKNISAPPLHQKIIKLDGSIVDVELVSSPFIFHGEKAFQVIARDITERKRIENFILLQRDLNNELIVTNKMDTAVDVIFKHAKKLDSIDSCGIYFKGKNGSFKLFNSTGLSDKSITELISYSADVVPIKTVSDGKPHYFSVNDSEFPNVFHRNREIIKSLASIPIIKDDEIIAILNLSSSKVAGFDLNQKSIIESFASQISAYINRILAEEEVKNSEEKYRAFFESDLTADFSSSIDGVLLDCNKAYVEMFEFDSKEHALHSKTHNLYINIDDRDYIYNELRNNKSLSLYETKVRTIKGKEIYIIENLIGDFDNNGNLLGATGYIFDITKMKIAENALIESEKRYRDLFDSMLDGFALHEIILDDQGEPIDYRFLAINKAYEKSTGLVAEKIIGKTLLEVMPLTEKYWIQTFGKVALTGVPERFENYARELGKYYRVLAYSPGKMKFAVIVEDVTEIRKSEEKIRQLSTAIEQSPVSVMITDLNGSIEYVNETFLRTTGFNRAEVIGMNPRLLKSGQMLQSEYEKIWRTILAGEVWSGVFYNKKKNDELFWEETKISPIRNSKGAITHFVAVKEDITERVKIENELEMHRSKLEELVNQRTHELDEVNIKLTEEIKKQKEYEIMLQQSLDKEKELSELKSKFISNTSHEFRTPLTAMMSSAELLQRYGKNWNTEKFSYYTNKIINAVEYLSDLLDDVLTISRSESGKISFNPKLLNVVKLCEQIIEETQVHSNRDHSINCEFDLPESELFLDEKLIRFIAMNLLSNAFKYSPKGGIVNFKTCIQKCNLILEISDEGIGIPKADQPYLFEPFHRAENTIEIEGTGLGLSIVKRSVDLHGGYISFNSEIGKGTTFTVSIPIKD